MHLIVLIKNVANVNVQPTDTVQTYIAHSFPLGVVSTIIKVNVGTVKAKFQ